MGGVTTKAPRLGRCGQAVAVAILLAILSPGLSAPVSGAAVPELSGGDFTILSPGTSTVIGHAHYSIDHAGSDDVLSGESRFLDGEYDVETNVLETASPGVTPALAAYQHRYYSRGGALQMDMRLDVKSGRALCSRYDGAEAETQSANLSLPADTYAGASLLIPIAYGLLRNQPDQITAHFFTCAPGPRLLAVQTNSRAGIRWPHYDGEACAVDVRPKLGWWDILIEPFVPKIRVWFDPADGFNYLGGDTQRYYRGPQVELVRDRNALGVPPAK